MKAVDSNAVPSAALHRCVFIYFSPFFPLSDWLYVCVCLGGAYVSLCVLCVLVCVRVVCEGRRCRRKVNDEIVAYECVSGTFAGVYYLSNAERERKGERGRTK